MTGLTRARRGLAVLLAVLGLAAHAEPVESTFAFMVEGHHPQAEAARRLATLLALESSGEWKLRLMPNGTAGDEVQMIDALAAGTVDFAVVDAIHRT